MKIAVIGSRGFIGRSIFNKLKSNHSVTGITRDTINVLEPQDVKSFLSANLFDVVINCAAIMTDNLSISDARNNFGMFMNFYDNRELFGKFINTASGAEYDRNTNMDSVDERLIFSRMPEDSYGWGQNMKSRICAQTDRFYNIRIFNAFGSGEPATRIFPRYLNSQDFTITNDRYFDYFGIDDLCTVVKDCTENLWKEKDVNAVYMNKYKISQVLTKFCNLKNLEPKFQVISSSKNNYTGSGNRLNALGIKLNGLEHSLLNY